MSNYHITMFGKRYACSKGTFWSITGPIMLAGIAWFVWMLYLSTTMIQHFTGIPAFIALILLVVLGGSITFQGGTEKRLLPEKVQEIMNGVVLSLTVVYAFFVLNYGFFLMLLLVLPLINKVLNKVNGK